MALMMMMMMMMMMIHSTVEDQTRVMNCILNHTNTHSEMSHTNTQAGFPSWRLSLPIFPS